MMLTVMVLLLIVDRYCYGDLIVLLIDNDLLLFIVSIDSYCLLLLLVLIVDSWYFIDI